MTVHNVPPLNGKEPAGHDAANQAVQTARQADQPANSNSHQPAPAHTRGNAVYLSAEASESPIPAHTRSSGGSLGSDGRRHPIPAHTQSNTGGTDSSPRPAAVSSHTLGKTVIVGSQGRMGAMLVKRAAVAGLVVEGVDVPLTPEKLASACDGALMAVICVPAAVFDDVVSAVCPHLPPNAVLTDITSVKEQPLRQMERVWPGPVVGTHPLFGPCPEPEADLPVAITPGHHAKPEHLGTVESFFTALGCRTFLTTAEKHDKAMARIQNMNFISNLAYFSLLAGQDDLLPFLTPSFRRRQNSARKMLTEDARLFAGLFEANAHSHEAVRQFRQMLNLAAAGDIDLLCERAGWWWPEEAPAANGGAQCEGEKE